MGPRNSLDTGFFWQAARLKHMPVFTRSHTIVVSSVPRPLTSTREGPAWQGSGETVFSFEVHLRAVRLMTTKNDSHGKIHLAVKLS